MTDFYDAREISRARCLLPKPGGRHPGANRPADRQDSGLNVRHRVDSGTGMGGSLEFAEPV
jgi:hypothetical protein